MKRDMECRKENETNKNEKKNVMRKGKRKATNESVKREEIWSMELPGCIEVLATRYISR